MFRSDALALKLRQRPARSLRARPRFRFDRPAGARLAREDSGMALRLAEDLAATPWRLGTSRSSRTVRVGRSRERCRRQAADALTGSALDPYHRAGRPAALDWVLESLHALDAYGVVVGHTRRPRAFVHRAVRVDPCQARRKRIGKARRTVWTLIRSEVSSALSWSRVHDARRNRENRPAVAITNDVSDRASSNDEDDDAYRRCGPRSRQARHDTDRIRRYRPAPDGGPRFRCDRSSVGRLRWA
jgi:hypothetical protein